MLKVVSKYGESGIQSERNIVSYELLKASLFPVALKWKAKR